MGISERKQREKEIVREKILEAAWRIVQEKGWVSLSLRNIAEAIEYSTPVIYNHFESKEALIRVFYRKGFQLLYNRLLEVANGKLDPDNKIYQVAMSYWNFAFENKHYYQVMFGVDVPCCVNEEILEEKKQMILLFQHIVEEALLINKNTVPDPALKRSTFWSILHGLVSINFTSRILKEEGKTEKVLDDAVLAFIKSLKV